MAINPILYALKQDRPRIINAYDCGIDLFTMAQLSIGMNQAYTIATPEVLQAARNFLAHVSDYKLNCIVCIGGKYDGVYVYPTMYFDDDGVIGACGLNFVATTDAKTAIVFECNITDGYVFVNAQMRTASTVVT